MGQESEGICLTGEKPRVLIVIEESDAYAGDTIPSEDGHCICRARGFSAGLREAQSQCFDMVVFVRQGADGGEAEIVRAARARNREVETACIEAEEVATARAALEETLKGAARSRDNRWGEARVETLLQGLFDGVLLVDLDRGAVTAVNRAGAAVLGYSQQEMCGMSMEELLRGQSEEDGKGVLERLAAAGSSGTEVLVLRKRNGEALRCCCNTSLVEEPSGEHIQIIFRPRREEELIRYSLEGEQSVPLRKVISHFVHEINNPLAAISGFAQLCLTTSSVEKQNDYMQTINDQAGRCRAIVGELSSLIKGAGHEEN